MPRKGERSTHCRRGHLRSPDNLYKGGICKTCAKASSTRRRQSAEYRAKHDATFYREYFKKNKERTLAAQRRYKYGLEPEDSQRLTEAQSNRCAICKFQFCEEKQVTCPRVDHDHSTEQVRGLLCNTCNAGLGHFKDNPDLLSAAISYLAHPPAHKILYPDMVRSL